MSTRDEHPKLSAWTRANGMLTNRPRISKPTTRLHILMPCHEYPPLGGAAGTVCRGLARHYLQAGHRVCVIAMGFEDLPEHERTDGIEVYRVACGRQDRDLASAWECLRWARRAATPVRRLDQRDPFDVVHAHFIMPGGIVGSRLKQRFGTPLIITAHGADVPGYQRDRWQVAHVIAHPWWRRICRAADVIVAPSHELADLLESQMHGLPVHVIPNGLGDQRSGDQQESAARPAVVRLEGAKLARRYEDLFHRQLARRGAA